MCRRMLRSRLHRRDGLRLQHGRLRQSCRLRLQRRRLKRSPRQIRQTKNKDGKLVCSEGAHASEVTSNICDVPGELASRVHELEQRKAKRGIKISQRGVK